MNSYSQSKDAEKYELRKFYAFALDGDIPQAMDELKANADRLDPEQLKVMEEFEKRFAGKEDVSAFLQSKSSEIDPLLKIYRDYWRSSFLEGESQEDVLKKELSGFFGADYSEVDSTIDEKLDNYLKSYLNDKNMKTTGFGKTGKYYDLLVWKNETDTVYEFDLHGQKISPRVVLMYDFVTLGWEEYATLGRYYPGGWATSEALYCVRDAYDLKSENFLISYLAHEGKHFEDYKIFPDLSGTDLEYRAKLVELSMAKESLYKLISFFTANADSSSGNPHSAANYFVIRDLSQRIFETSFETDKNAWESVPATKINEVSYILLEENTNALLDLGTNAKSILKP